MNVEEDEAGRLKRFRKRFGRGYDAESMSVGEEKRDGMDDGIEGAEDMNEENLLDLISGYGAGEGKSDKKADKAPSKDAKDGKGSAKK